MAISCDTIARARDADILATAERLGATLKRVTATERAGPCLRCGGTDRFSVNSKQQVWNCRGCGKGGGPIDLVMHAHELNFPQAVEFLCDDVVKGAARPTRTIRAPRPQPDAGDSTAPRTSDALKVWSEGVDPRGTLAELYLSARGLNLGEDIADNVLRWHPRIGAMIALFRNIHTDEPQAISRTCLDAEGRKLGRKFLGPVGGCAVKLDADEEVTHGLHVGEGIETCMAARQIGLKPAWALGSANAIAGFPVLSGVEALSLLRELDEANRRAADECARRWIDAGRSVYDVWPEAGKDVNDSLRARP